MDPFEMGMMMRGSHPSQQANNMALAERAEKKAEQERTQAQEVQTLRKLMSIYEPNRKDQFTTMNLADLRGESMAYAGKAAEAKARQETLKTQRDEQSAQSLQALIGELGQTTPTRFPSTTLPGIFPDTVAGTRPTLGDVLAKHPSAINATHGPQTLKMLQDIYGEESTSGGLEFITSPTGAVITRSRKTDQFQYDPISKADAEQNRTRFSVEPIIDRFGRAAGYGVKAQFGSEAEAKAWADKQNQTSDKPEATAPDETIYESEAAAKKAGKETGDVFRLKGVGKVRLK